MLPAAEGQLSTADFFLSLGILTHFWQSTVCFIEHVLSVLSCDKFANNLQTKQPHQLIMCAFSLAASDISNRMPRTCYCNLLEIKYFEVF